MWVSSSFVEIVLYPQISHCLAVTTWTLLQSCMPQQFCIKCRNLSLESIIDQEFDLEQREEPSLEVNGSRLMFTGSR